MQASLKPPFAITFFSTFAFLVSINCGNMHCLRAVWNISNDGIILWIPYWLSIAYVNAFNHVKLKSRDLTLSFQKGKGGRVQWRDTNAKAINIHPLCLSQLFHMAIANFMPRIRHQCPHLRIEGASVAVVIHSTPASASGRNMVFEYQSGRWPVHPAPLLHGLSFHYNNSAHSQCSCCPNNVTTSINPTTDARQHVVCSCLCKRCSLCSRHLSPDDRKT